MTQTGTQPAQSIQFQALVYVAALLGGETAGVYRCRLNPFAQKQLPADNVLPLLEDGEYVYASVLDNKFRFTVRHMAVAADGADAIADQRYVRAARLILADPTLGGLATVVRYVGRKWEFDGEGEVDVVALAVTYEVEFSTAPADPSVQGI